MSRLSLSILASTTSCGAVRTCCDTHPHCVSQASSIAQLKPGAAWKGISWLVRLLNSLALVHAQLNARHSAVTSTALLEDTPLDARAKCVFCT